MSLFGYRDQNICLILMGACDSAELKTRDVIPLSSLRHFPLQWFCLPALDQVFLKLHTCFPGAESHKGCGDGPGLGSALCVVQTPGLEGRVKSSGDLLFVSLTWTSEDFRTSQSAAKAVPGLRGASLCPNPVPGADPTPLWPEWGSLSAGGHRGYGYSRNV